MPAQPKLKLTPEQQGRLEKVTKALLEFEGYPACALQMLVEGIPHIASSGSGGEQHEYLSQYAALVREALQDATRSAVEKQEIANNSVATIEESLQQLSAERDTLAEQEKAAEAESTTRTTQLQEAKAAVAEGDKEYAQAQDMVKDHLKKMANLRKEKEHAANILDNMFRMVVDGSWENEQAKVAAVDSVRQHLESINTEPALVAAAATALATSPSCRKAFDQVTVDATTDVLERQASDLASRLAAGEPEEMEADAECLGHWAILEVARERAEKAKQAAKEAKANFDAAVTARQAFQKKVSKEEQSQKVCRAEQTLAIEKVRELGEASEAFEQLLVAPGTAEEETGDGDVDMAKEDEHAGDVKVGTGEATVAVAKEGVIQQTEVVSGNPLNVPTPMSVN